MAVRGSFERLDQTYLNGIVTRARQGSSNAFAELFASVSGRQLWYLTRLFGSREDAIAAMPEVFTKVYRGLPSFTKTDLFMPWICRISALTYMERTGQMSVQGSGYDVSQILKLPLAESQMMLMRDVQGLSDDETADLLNVGRRTVRRFVRMGRRHLAKHSASGAGTDQSGRRPSNGPATKKGVTAGRASSELTTLETSEILDSVFSACGGEANSVPMETISSYAVYRKERFRLQRSVLIIALVIFALLPLLFILPECDVAVEDSGERGLPVYTLDVDSILPVRSVTAAIGDHMLPVYEAGAKEFSIEPTGNGTLDIRVELINRQKVSMECDVTAVDAEAPELLESSMTDDGLLLRVTDSGIGVDYRRVYAEDKTGERHQPEKASEEDGILFTDPASGWEICVPDHVGNMLRISVKND